jgi:hypothetical protein
MKFRKKKSLRFDKNKNEEESKHVLKMMSESTFMRTFESTVVFRVNRNDYVCISMHVHVCEVGQMLAGSSFGSCERSHLPVQGRPHLSKNRFVRAETTQLLLPKQASLKAAC